MHVVTRPGELLQKFSMVQHAIKELWKQELLKWHF